MVVQILFAEMIFFCLEQVVVDDLSYDTKQCTDLCTRKSLLETGQGDIIRIIDNQTAVPVEDG